MIALKRRLLHLAATCSTAIMVTLGAAVTAHAQTAARGCRPAEVIPLTGPEPAPTLVVNAPLEEPLTSRRVVVISYCANHMRLAPVFGPAALGVSPRVGHVHVSVDGTAWVWADASGNPLILAGLTPGPHKVRMDLVNANHQMVDTQTVTFDVPGTPSGVTTP